MRQNEGQSYRDYLEMLEREQSSPATDFTLSFAESPSLMERLSYEEFKVIIEDYMKGLG